jgi:mycothiol S-conjugate amidase
VNATTDRAMIAVHAHPDDESSKGAATMARYAAEGVRVVVATFTGGERGDVLNPSLRHRTDIAERLPEVRKEEMARAAAALGVEHRFLGFVDSGLPEGDPLPPLPEGSFALVDPVDAAIPLVALIREVRPQVLTTYDPTGGYPHPDHIHTHTVTMEAIRQAADPQVHPELGQAFEVPKVYYNQAFSPQRIEAANEAMIEAGMTSPFGDWLSDRSARPFPAPRITTRVDVADFFDARDAALRAHATQVDPDGFFFAIPRSIEVAVWPHEDYELASSTVPVSIPETDLFAGIA